MQVVFIHKSCAHGGRRGKVSKFQQLVHVVAGTWAHNAIHGAVVADGAHATGHCAHRRRLL